MSKKINIILLSLFVFQALLIAVLYMPGSKKIQTEVAFFEGSVRSGLGFVFFSYFVLPF